MQSIPTSTANNDFYNPNKVPPMPSLTTAAGTFTTSKVNHSAVSSTMGMTVLVKGPDGRQTAYTWVLRNHFTCASLDLRAHTEDDAIRATLAAHVKALG